MVSFLPVLPCESSVSVKENTDRKKIAKVKAMASTGWKTMVTDWNYALLG